MNISRVNDLYGHTAMTPSERRLGRFLRAPEGHDASAGGGGAPPPPSPAPAGNNGGGNQGDSNASGTADTNNSGHGVDLDTFWQQPGGDGTGTTDSAGTNPPSSGQQPNQQQANPGTEFGKQLADRINTLTFPDPFTPDITRQVSEGDLGGINKAFATFGQEAVRQSLVMNAQMMGRFGEGLVARVESMIATALGNRDNNETLLEAFPSAKDARARPLIESVFNQALRHTNNDRQKAILLARDMLKLVGTTAATDLGLQVPPANGEDTFNQGSGPSRLVEELLARP